MKAIEKTSLSLLEGQIKDVNKLRKDILSESKQFLKEDFEKHQNDIYIPALNESTGEKTYITKNFDEILAEAENDKTKTKDDLTRYDHVFEMLSESIDYERSLHFNENKEQLDEFLGEPDWEKRGAEVEAGDVETDKYDAEGKPKSMATRVEETWSKGKIYFFLKTVDLGLKAALKASRSILGIISGLIMKFSTASLRAWAKAEMKTSEIWANIKNIASEKLAPYTKKLIKPFLWISSKLTKDVEKQKLYVPILISITISCAMIALLYAFGAFNIFGQAVDGTAEGMEASTKLLADANPDWLSAVCGAAGALTAEGLLREESLEDCGMILQNGKKLTHQQTQKVLKHLVDEIKEDIGNSSVFTMIDQSTSSTVGDVATDAASHVSSGWAGDASSAVVDRQIAGFNYMIEKFSGMGDEVIGQAGEALDLRDTNISLLISNELQKAAIQTVGGIKDGVYEASLEAGGEAAKAAAKEELSAFLASKVFTHSMDSIMETVTEETTRAGLQSTKQTVISIMQSQVTGLKENLLTDKEVLRFKKLTGLI